MKLLTMKFADGRTDTILGVQFIDGLSTEVITRAFIEKYTVLGDNAKFTVIEEEYVPKQKYDILQTEYNKLLSKVNKNKD